MLYTSLTKKAMKIAYEAHRDQVDQAGMPYIFHPILVAEQLTEEYAVCVGLLHDVVEDTDVTLEQLRQAGFPEEVLEALALLTHDPAVSYEEYVKKIRENPLAKAVKLADINHNSDHTRLEAGDPRATRWNAKYARARALLTEG